MTAIKPIHRERELERWLADQPGGTAGVRPTPRNAAGATAATTRLILRGSTSPTYCAASSPKGLRDAS
jgi:hypothetical protein